jgi:hypothetical protein
MTEVRVSGGLVIRWSDLDGGLVRIVWQICLGCFGNAFVSRAVFMGISLNNSRAEPYFAGLLRVFFNSVARMRPVLFERANAHLLV